MLLTNKTQATASVNILLLTKLTNHQEIAQNPRRIRAPPNNHHYYYYYYYYYNPSVDPKQQCS